MAYDGLAHRDVRFLASAGRLAPTGSLQIISRLRGGGAWRATGELGTSVERRTKLSVEATRTGRIGEGIGHVAHLRDQAGRELAASRAGWIISPLFDLLFFANIYWVLALLPIYMGGDSEPYVQFWMAYFLATPHRWLTLVVATTDRDRRYGQTWLFIVIAVLTALLIGLTLWTTGDFRSLFLFYTLLLGWHFAGQHSNVLKVYSGKGAPGVRLLEDWLPMTFVLYANIRLVSFLGPMLHFEQLAWPSLIDLFDVVILVIPVVMLGTELARFSPRRVPKIIYMLSFFSLWTSVLWAAHLHRNGWCSILLGAVTIFHSVEYMALVSYYAWQRQELGAANLFQTMARNWTVVFAWYVIGCGLLYSLGNAFFAVACYAVNTWASILHCAYDGMMWRLRRPETATVFGIETPAEAGTGSG